MKELQSQVGIFLIFTHHFMVEGTLAKWSRREAYDKVDKTW